MGFPLGDWIDRHRGLPHNLAASGMLGSLSTVAGLLRRPGVGRAEAVRRRLARRLSVERDRLFLTHGATEGDGLVLRFLAAELRGRRARTTYWAPRPEYPPLRAQAGWAGLREVGGPERASVVVLSSPNNPCGRPGPLPGRRPPGGATLVDETFREFQPGPSLAREDRPGLWVTGTLTKAFGADEVRCGWVVAPSRSAARFSDFHAVMTDALSPASAGMADRCLAHASPILAEARRLFEANRSVLAERFPAAADLVAPVYFDSDPAMDGDRLAARAVRAGVLVCPGSYFGDRRGVRLCLTRRSFPSDLEAYLAVRERYLKDRARASAAG